MQAVAQPFVLTPALALAAPRVSEGSIVLLRDGRELVGRSYGWAVLDPASGLGPVPVSALQAEKILRSMLPSPVRAPGLIAFQNGAG